MSRTGLTRALSYIVELPVFLNKAEARRQLFAERDRLLRSLRKLTLRNGSFVPDLTVESLRGIERWYFELLDSRSFKRLATSREEFECGMAVYFYSVVVANCPRARWCVESSPFVRCRHEVGVDLETFSVVCWRFSDHHRAPNNRRRDLVWREYQRYFGGEDAVTSDHSRRRNPSGKITRDAQE